MYNKIFKLSAVASVVVASIATAHAAVNVSTTVDATDNLYFTGLVPSAYQAYQEDGTPPDGPGPDIGLPDYTSWQMALDGYPTESDPRAPLNCVASPVSPDATRSCFGSVPAVASLANFGGTTLHVRVSGTANASTPLGAAGNPSVNNGLATGGLVAIFASNDTSGSTGGVSHDGLAMANGLEDYANAVPDTLDNTTTGRLDNSFEVVGFRSTHPGFTAVGTEFLLVDGVTVDGNGDYVTSMTIPTGATHIILAYNETQNNFGSGATDTFSVDLADNAAFDSTGIPANVSVAVTRGSDTLTANSGTGAFDIFKGDTLSFDATATPGTQNSLTGAAIAADDYSWTVGGTAISGNTSDTLSAQTFNTVGVIPVVLTIVDSANVTTTETLNVNVQPIVPTASFTSAVNGLTASFTDGSSGVNGATIASWAWDFGVAGITSDTSTLENPQYTYTAAGDYTVTLTVTDSQGETSAAATRTVSVAAVPTTTSGGGGGALSFLGLGLLAPAFIRRRLQK